VSRYKPKDAPVVPVVGGAVASSGGDREEKMRQWEAEQAARLAAAQPVVVATAAPVAPEVPAQQTTAPLAAAAAAPAAEVAVTPPAALPDPGAPQEEQLAVCERAIHGAKARWTAATEAANTAYVDEAGPYLAWVHQHKLYRLVLDNGGTAYRSFERYLKEQHDLSKATGYRITRTIPLLRILTEGGHPLPDLSVRQVQVLHPVRVQHGDVEALKVWTTAWETKKAPLPTPEELDKARQLLGLATKADDDEDDGDAAARARALGVADAGAAVERAAKILVPDTVREAVRKDPDRVRMLYRVLGSALNEAGVVVD
jgi:hypothetical protein